MWDYRLLAGTGRQQTGQRSTGREKGDTPVILIGTSGYSYKDWIGPVYPFGTRSGEMLSRYAAEFSFTELNFTYYRMPDSRQLQRMQAQTPPGFQFAVKANRQLTHEREQATPEAFAAFRTALEPLRAAGKLACVVAQFPYSFHRRPGNVDYLYRLREGLPDLDIQVEFRNASWLVPETGTVLRELSLGYVCVDEPRLKGLIPPFATATTPTGYIRFHGRNAAKWYAHRHAYERYDYLYSEGELAEWVPRIRKLQARTRRIFIAFNNHFGGQAVANARMLRALLDSC